MVTLPPPYFFNSEVPLVFYNNQVYRPTSKSKRDSIKFLDKKYSLTSIGTLKELEKLYLENNSELIFQFKKEFLERKISHSLIETDKVSRQLRDNKILALIIKEILPALREDPQYRSERRIRSEISSVAPSSRITQEVKSKLIEQIEREHSDDFYQIPNNQLLLSKRLYDLERNYDSSIQVKIGNTKLGLLKSAIDFPGSHQFQSVSYASELYINKLAKELKIQAVKQDLTNTSKLAKISKERQELEAILRRSNYEESGAGFKKSSNGYYVFVELPEYVLLSPHNRNLYRFKPLKIGVELTCSERGSIKVGRPVALNGRYSHPFLPSYYSGNRHICLGSYGYTRVQNMPPVDAVLQFLYDARNIMMHSYSRGRHPHSRLTEDNFRSKRISLEEVRRLNLPITNQALVEQHRGERIGPR